MLVWCITLFCLGILAFTDSIFNYGEIFRKVNSIVFMLLSLGLLVRTSLMMKLGNREKLIERNSELEKQVGKESRSTTPVNRTAEASVN